MSPPRPVGVDQIGEFDTIVDARSPAEFALDHVPGAINCPVLDDDERRIVGTLYAQQGAFEARRVGGAMVAANLARHLRERFAEQPVGWRPLVYCWRGGMRSGSMVQWLRLVGWEAQQLAGGYKRWRRHVIDSIERLAPQLRLRVLFGPTGSGKTRLLQALAADGAQVLDLEALAEHRGSVLGGRPGQSQPAQTAFETRLAQALWALDPAEPVFIEAESRRIGKLNLPTPLWDRMRRSPCLRIEAPLAARLAHLLRDYADLGDDVEHLAGQLGLLKGLQSSETVARWQAWARQGALAPLYEALMREHYDPLYARSQHAYYLHWAQAVPIQTDSLEPAVLNRLAPGVRALKVTPPDPGDPPIPA